MSRWQNHEEQVAKMSRLYLESFGRYQLNQLTTCRHMEATNEALCLIEEKFKTLTTLDFAGALELVQELASSVQWLTVHASTCAVCNHMLLVRAQKPK